MRPMCQMLVIVLLFLAERLTHVLSLQSPYIAVVTGRLSCTHQLVLFNANLCNLYTIILHKPGGAFSSEPHHCLFLQASSDRNCDLNAVLYKVDMICLICLVGGCCCPPLIYSIEINFMSVFMSFKYVYELDVPRKTY